MSKGPRVFLSHTTQDRRDHALAHALARGLRARGADVWIAPDSIPPGDRWADELVAGIMEDCNVFLVIVSAASRHSGWVGDEISLARRRSEHDEHFRVLPLVVGSVEDHPHAEFLGQLQHVPYQPAFYDQLNEVVAAIGLRPRTRVTLPPSAVPSDEFVGRGYLFDAVDAFVNSEPNGYFVFEADPGVGKSAFLAEFARREDAIVHFNIRSLGITSTRQFQSSVAEQLIERFALPHVLTDEDVGGSGALLVKLLDDAAEQLDDGQRLIIAIDSLDEVETAGHLLGANILFLPPSLPMGVYVVMTRRDVAVSFTTTAPYKICRLSEFGDAACRDAADYIERSLRDSRLRAWVAERDLEVDEFTTALADKSECNFMYLRHVLPALATGAYADLELETLPDGLEQYYESHWQRMGMTARPPPVTRIRIVYILSEARLPVSRSLVSQFASSAEMIIDELEVQAVLEDWREFLHETTGDETSYALYHASFREFLHRKDIVQAAGLTLSDIHALIADNLWSNLFEDDRHRT